MLERERKLEVLWLRAGPRQGGELEQGTFSTSALLTSGAG